jgi:hypothetical protein
LVLLLVKTLTYLEAKMASRIKLEIGTGNGNTVLVADLSTLNPAYEPLFLIAFQGAILGDYNGRPANDIAGKIDQAVDSLRDRRGDYAGLSPTEQEYRQPFLEYCLRWREKCREHPNASVYINP